MYESKVNYENEVKNWSNWLVRQPVQSSCSFELLSSANPPTQHHQVQQAQLYEIFSRAPVIAKLHSNVI